MSKLALQLWDANEELIQIVIAAVNHCDYQAIVAHNVILERFRPANALNEAFAGLFSLIADSAGAIVNLADVQLLSHLLSDISAKCTKEGLPEDVFLGALVWFPVDLHRSGPIAHARHAGVIRDATSTDHI